MRAPHECFSKLYHACCTAVQSGGMYGCYMLTTPQRVGGAKIFTDKCAALQRCCKHMCQ